MRAPTSARGGHHEWVSFAGRLGFGWLTILLLVMALAACSRSKSDVERALDRMEEALQPLLGSPQARGGMGLTVPST
jgi:hypothetical protein